MDMDTKKNSTLMEALEWLVDGNDFSNEDNYDWFSETKREYYEKEEITDNIYVSFSHVLISSLKYKICYGFYYTPSCIRGEEPDRNYIYLL